MRKKQKQCCVRLPEDLHRKAKLRAYEEGLSLQQWVIELMTEELIPDISPPKRQVSTCKPD